MARTPVVVKDVLENDFLKWELIFDSGMRTLREFYTLWMITFLTFLNFIRFTQPVRRLRDFNFQQGLVMTYGIVFIDTVLISLLRS